MNLSGHNQGENYPRSDKFRYKLSGMLKDYLDRLSTDPNAEDHLKNILRTINNYSAQLANAGRQSRALAAKTAHDTIEKIILTAPEEDKKDIRCKAGCTACCFVDASITSEEATLIVEYCHKNNIAIDWDYLIKQVARGRKDFSELSKCVFLENDLCGIYEVRPSTCRKHFVLSDPALCDSSKNKDIPLDTYFNLQSEMVTSALMNLSTTGPIEKMLLDELGRE
jgi:Fe-S-cluster containining protein